MHAAEDASVNILIAAIHYPSASGRFIKRAFERLGHSVKTVGPCTGNEIWGVKVDPRHIWQPDIDLSHISQQSATAERVLDTLADGDWQPDLIITADSAFTLIGDTPCPHVLWGVDNHVRGYQIGGKSVWDWMFLAHGKAQRMEEDNAVWLPCAYDPEVHVNNTPFYQRQMHAAIVGVAYPPRQELATALSRHFRVVTGTGLLFSEYTDVYNNAVVSLCKSVAHDAAQRVFESAAMGCVVLSDPCHDFEALGYKDGEHYLQYETPDDAIAQVRALLDGPPERIGQLVSAGLEWVAPHTWDARAQKVLDVVFGKQESK